MNIYIIPVNKVFQPETAKIKYPRHSSYIGVERVFYNWMKEQRAVLVQNAKEADWCYLPIFWTNYFLNHDFAKSGIEELEAECKRVLTFPEKTFTLCQYAQGPIVDLKGAVCFLASRKKENGFDFDMPLLCSPHKFVKRRKKYIASFVGRVSTHPVRRELCRIIKHDRQFLFLGGRWGEKVFVRVMEKSYVCFCPRGFGGGSFRFYEAMQMGVVPVHIGDIDVRPFKNQIDWESCSFYFEDPFEAVRVLKRCSEEKLLDMGNQAARIYKDIFSDDHWCGYLLCELSGGGRESSKQEEKS